MHASPISEAPSCTLSFFLHPSTCPPSQSQSYPTPSIIRLRRRPLYCGSVPRYCSQHIGIVHVLRHDFSSRPSRRSRHGTQIFCLGSKHTPLLIRLPPTFPVVLLPATLFIAAHICINTPPHQSPRLPPRSSCTGV